MKCASVSSVMSMRVRATNFLLQAIDLSQLVQIVDIKYVFVRSS